ncbi:GABA transporter 1 [Beta vulgaris subsp. vulgaris]|uniref:GABA transporter 1 n=1 Tax=Beta vulgaris subsp. vulgaris TaxID=3555 RepID=UPI0020372293|nr:GABA transporter 1 [Beta vulgaris subsp. vulgaris]
MASASPKETLLESAAVPLLPKHIDEDDDASLYALQCHGTWLHCGYHLTTSIVSPSLLNLPYAICLLGWSTGMIFIIIGALVTFYSFNLLSLVLEHYASKGLRFLRFQDLADHILGATFGRYFVGPVQLAVCYGAVVGLIILGGQCMKTVYSLAWPNGEMELYEFVIIYGGLVLLVAQVPSFHSLRHISLISLALSLAYSAFATAGSIYIGNISTETKDYAIVGNTENKIFGSFTAITMIAASFGNGIIPEIQATLAAPVKGKMFKGLSLCYTVVLITFFSVAISGYWAFGNGTSSFIIDNFVDSEGNVLVPKWFLFTTLSFIILQVSAVSGVYLQPANILLEEMFVDPKCKPFSLRNVISRVISRSISVMIATTIAALLPFFGDVNALIGAFGFIPLDFILPVVFFNLTFKPSKRSIIFWLNIIIATVFSLIMVIGIFAAVRQMIFDANDFHSPDRLSSSWTLSSLGKTSWKSFSSYLTKNIYSFSSI